MWEYKAYQGYGPYETIVVRLEDEFNEDGTHFQYVEYTKFDEKKINVTDYNGNIYPKGSPMEVQLYRQLSGGIIHCLGQKMDQIIPAKTELE